MVTTPRTMARIARAMMPNLINHLSGVENSLKAPSIGRDVDSEWVSFDIVTLTSMMPSFFKLFVYFFETTNALFFKKNNSKIWIS